MIAGLVVSAPAAADSTPEPSPEPTATVVTTGTQTVVTTDPGAPVPPPASVPADAPPAQAAEGFAADQLPTPVPASDTRTDSVTPLPDGGHVVRLQQTVAGVPVVGGETVVQLTADNHLLSAVSETASAAPASLAPRVTRDRAQATAVITVGAGRRGGTAGLSASTPSLWVFDPRILDAPGAGTVIPVWRTEVTSSTDSSLRQLVLVDAITGKVALSFNQVAQANRTVCDNQNVGGLSESCTSPVRSEGDPAAGDSDIDSAYSFAGDTAAFYADVLGRDSVDGHGMALASTVRFCDLRSGTCNPFGSTAFANAYWNGEQMVYGDGYASAQDVVGHELTHGVTQYGADLFYYHQSGAINESLSDIFGELIDQSSHDTEGGSLTDTDSSAVAWQVGEDLPGGAIRSMRNPAGFLVRNSTGDLVPEGDPDRMGSPNFYTGEEDGGGVHFNSGVGNKFTWLVTDGGTFNGRTVTGIGIERTAQIVYRASQLLTSASDYRAFAGALRSACQALAAAPSALTPSDDKVTLTHCTQVNSAIAAVQMNLRPGIAAVPMCRSGATPRVLFRDDMEGPKRWSPAGSPLDWYYADQPNPYAFTPKYATSGFNNLWGNDSGSAGSPSMGMVPAAKVALPRPTTPLTYTVRFNHAYAFWPNSGAATVDGGVVEYNLDDGRGWQRVTSSRYLRDGGYGGYNGTMRARTDNPLSGSAGFVGHSRGYVASRFDVTDLAGHSLRLRFRIGSANTNTQGDYGWFIDDVTVTACPRLKQVAVSGLTARSHAVDVRWVKVKNATRFTVTAYPGGRTCTSTTTTCRIRGLVAGKPYRFVVRATGTGWEPSTGPLSAAVRPKT